MSIDHSAPQFSAPQNSAPQNSAPQFPGAPAEHGAPGAGAPPRRSRVVLTLVLSGAALVCSIVVAALAFLGGASSVPASSVASQLTQQYGAPVSCSQDLPAKVGATTTCTGTDDQGAHQLLVTATSVDGDQVAFTASPQG